MAIEAGKQVAFVSTEWYPLRKREPQLPKRKVTVLACDGDDTSSADLHEAIIHIR